MSETVTAKVCIVSPSIYPLFNRMAKGPYSGSETQLYELAKYLGNDDSIDISIVTGDFGQDDVEYDSGSLIYRTDFRSAKPFYQRWFAKEESVEDCLKQTGADIFLMSGAHPACFDVSEYCRKYHKGFVYRIAHVRECDRSYAQSKGEDGEKFQKALHQADAVICPSQELKLLVKRTEKISARVIPNALPIAPLSRENRYDVLWCGAAAPWKQPEMFMRLALTLPEHSFTMIAFPDQAGYFEKLVASTRDVPNLGFQNSVPYPELRPFIGRAKLLVNTSRFEGFPFLFSQAMAEGIPVVSLNVNPDGALSRRQAGICAEGSEKQLVEAVHDLLLYERQWLRYSGNARSYAEETFDIQRVSKDYRLLFYKLAVSKRRR